MIPVIRDPLRRVVFLLLILLVSLAWTGLNLPLSYLYSTTAQIPTTGRVVAPALQYVNGDKIFENGGEVIWRSIATSYLFHTNDFMTAWQNHLPEIEAMGLNVIRLAFSFPLDVGASADVLNYTKLDWVLNFLAQNGIKAVLDNHAGVNSSIKSFGTTAVISAWKDLAARYVGDSKIVAYELYNEPGPWRWDISIKSQLDVAKFYANLTRQLRTVDPKHIVIWQAGNTYLPPWEKWFPQYAQPNVVYSVHAWWTRKMWQFDVWTPDQISLRTMDPIVLTRAKWQVPFWLGEFGITNWPYNASNPEWVLTERNLWRCEEQVVGWSLWMGEVDSGIPWSQYLPFFPLKVYSAQLVRQPWVDAFPHLQDYITASGGVDNLGNISLDLLHNGDYIILKLGIQIQVVVTQRLADGSVKVVSNNNINVTSPLTIRNEEGTIAHPDESDTFIYV